MNHPPPKKAHPRVLHFVTHLGLGGAENVALQLAGEFQPGGNSAIFAVQGVETGAVGRSMGAALATQGIAFYRGTGVPLKFGGLLLAGIRAAQAVTQFKPEVIHLHTEIPEAAYAVMVTLRPSLARIAVTRTIHNSVYWHHWPRLGRWCEQRMSHAHVAAVSADAWRSFVQHRATSGAGAPAALPLVIHNGVADFSPVTREPRLPGQSVRLLFAGRFDEQKGADLLPEVLRLIRLEAGSTGELTLFGAGCLQTVLEVLAANPPTRWVVRLHDPVAGLPALINGYDLVLMPSRHEGLSLMAIESMMAGVPLITTDAPGMREALPPDHPWVAPAGNAAAFAEAIERAIRERATWPEIAERANRFAREQFNVTQMHARYRQLYARALSEPRQNPR